jgi:CDGSH-type Zn-finger protein
VTLREGEPVKITATENGPNKIEGAGPYRVVREGKEETIERTTIFLCRCGHSKNKPFCDGTHKTVGFQAPEVLVEPVGD